MLPSITNNNLKQNNCFVMIVMQKNVNKITKNVNNSRLLTKNNILLFFVNKFFVLLCKLHNKIVMNFVNNS